MFKILIFHILSIIFYLLNYLFLGAWSGLVIIILELLRDFLYYKTDKDNLKGYITTISIPKETLNKILEITSIQSEYEKLILDSNNYGKSLIIDSIVLKEKYQNKKTKELIIKNIYKLLKNKKYNNIVIVTSTDFEKEIARKLKYIEIKKLSDDSIFYINKGI